MSREANIPLVLWITAAMVAHLAGGESAVQVAQVQQDRADLRAIARGMRGRSTPRERAPFVYRDRGSMAVIGKAKAVVEIGRFRLTRRGRHMHLDVAVDARKYRELLEVSARRESWDWGDQ